MDTLIAFRQEIDSLTDLEYQQCIELIGRKLITSLIFIGLHQQIHQDKKNNNLSKILEIVTQIKESRENEEYTDLPLNNGHNYQLDDIPSVLLSEISSFLTLNDKIRFEQTNRSVLIGVRFYKLPLYPLSAHNFVKLAKYSEKHDDKYISSINPIYKSVIIDNQAITRYDENSDDTYENDWKILYSFNYFKLFSNVTTLELHAECYTSTESIVFHLFKCTNLPNVKTLRIIYDDWLDLYDGKDIFQLRQLINLPRLEYFEIATNLEDGDISHCYYEWISVLKGFAMTNPMRSNMINSICINNMMENIHKSFGNNLESFHHG
eukprot:500453_1